MGEYKPYSVLLFNDKVMERGKALCSDTDDHFSVGYIKWTLRFVKKYGKNVDKWELLFKSSERFAFCGSWKVEGTLIINCCNTDDQLVKTSFACSDCHPSHTIELGKEMQDRSVDLEFQFTKLVGMGVTPRPNYFEPSGMTDVCLIVGEEEDKVKLHLSKAVLGSFSHYFKAMFYGEFAEKDKSEVELQDICADDFVDLLDICFEAFLFQNERDDDTSIDSLFVLADRLCMHVATQRLQSFVVEHYSYDEHRVISHLVWADKFNLPVLMTRVMETFTLADVKRLQKMDERHQLSSATLLAVLGVATGNLGD